MFDSKEIKANLVMAIPILISSLVVFGSIIVNAGIVGRANLMNWYILGLYLPVNYFILGLLESGRVCSITLITKNINVNNFRECIVISIYYALPFVSIAICFMVLYACSLNPFNVVVAIYPKFIHFVVSYSLAYILVSTNSIFNAALFAFKRGVFATINIVCVSVLSIVITYILANVYDMGIYSIIIGVIIAYFYGAIISIIVIYNMSKRLIINKNKNRMIWVSTYKLCMSIGFPVFLAYLSLPLSIYIITNIVSGMSLDLVTGFGIAYRVQNFIILPAIALGISAGININYLNTINRIQIIIKNTLLLNIIMYLPLVFIIYYFRQNIAILLTNNIDVQQIIACYFKYISWSYIVWCPLISIIAILEQTGLPFRSLISNISMLSLQVIITLYVSIYHYSTVQFFQLSSITTIVIAICLLIINIRKYHNTLFKRSIYA